MANMHLNAFFLLNFNLLKPFDVKNQIGGIPGAFQRFLGPLVKCLQLLMSEGMTVVGCLPLHHHCSLPKLLILKGVMSGFLLVM